MVNWVEAQKPILHWFARLYGLRQQIVEVEPGTSLTFWVPKDAATNVDKPAVVLVHGFAAEGIVTWQFQVDCIDFNFMCSVVAGENDRSLRPPTIDLLLSSRRKFGSLTKEYNVYVPDLLFFGGSTTTSSDRSPEFQARCLGKALDALDVKTCTLVGFSYGGMVAFKLAEVKPDLVEAMVISGSVINMTDSISQETLSRLGFSSSSDLLMPESVKGLKALLSVATHRKLWFPNFLYRDYLEVMFSNRKERAELLEGLTVGGNAPILHRFPQRIHLLWGGEDRIFDIELAKRMKERLGEKVTLQSIRKAGHLVHLERPAVYRRCLKKVLQQYHGSKQAH